MSKLFEIYHTKALPKGFFSGVEYEIEQVQGLSTTVSNKFGVEADGSLKDNGKEFVTPVWDFKTQLDGFLSLHNNLTLGPDPFPESTSIHVHVNVGNLTPGQLKAMILGYVLTEELFFSLVKPSRRDSIFCVPVTETFLVSQLHRPVETLIKKWHKYAAFNVRPIFCNDKTGGQPLGTVEFRHMHGNNNYPLFEQWLSSIKELFSFFEEKEGAINVPQKVVNQTKAVSFVKEMTPSLVKGLSNDMIWDKIYNNCLDVKLSVGGI